MYIFNTATKMESSKCTVVLYKLSKAISFAMELRDFVTKLRSRKHEIFYNWSNHWIYKVSLKSSVKGVIWTETWCLCARIAWFFRDMGESIHSMDCMWPAVKIDCGQMNVVSVGGNVTEQWATCKHQVPLQIGEKFNGDAWNFEAMSRKCVYERFKRFLKRKETTEDEPRSRRPSISRTPEMIEKVRHILAQDRRLTLRLTAEELNISMDTAHTTVPDDLVKRTICSWFVPHKLTDEQRAKRMETSGDLISMCDQDPLLLENIITGYETWFYQFDPELKRQSMAWRSPTSPRPKKESSTKIQA